MWWQSRSNCKHMNVHKCNFKRIKKVTDAFWNAWFLAATRYVVCAWYTRTIDNKRLMPSIMVNTEQKLKFHIKFFISRDYLNNHWTKHNLVCTHLNAFFMLNPHMAMKSEFRTFLEKKPILTRCLASTSAWRGLIRPQMILWVVQVPY